MFEEPQDPMPDEEPDGEPGRAGRQKGAQQHAEGMQGPVTRARFLEQLHSGSAAPAEGAEAHSHEGDGEHRLFERREQHDHAERNSEKNRLDRDIREHGHNRENFQVQGGSASSRAAPRNPINPTEPDAPTPGVPPAPPPTRVPGVGGS